MTIDDNWWRQLMTIDDNNDDNWWKVVQFETFICKILFDTFYTIYVLWKVIFSMSLSSK